VSVRPCLRWPDPRLRRAAMKVTKISAATSAIWDDMIDTMEAMPGYGLAAPQIGVMLRLAVVDASTGRGQAVRMANPEILSASHETAAVDEASPNLPGVSARLVRPARVTVRFLNREGMIDRREFEGLWAASAQHQIDHLDGKMFFDRLSTIRRRMVLKKAEKMRKRK